MSDTYRTGRTLGTTIYQNDDEQPCIWVPNSRTLAAQIVALLNGEADARKAVAALSASADRIAAIEAELKAAKRDTKRLEAALERLYEAAG